MAKATGIGGIFFKYKDEQAMKQWYETALGLTPNDYGVLFSFNRSGNAEGYLQLGAFEASSDYFGKESQQAMINFRVDDMEGLEQHLRSMGTTICNEMEKRTSTANSSTSKILKETALSCGSLLIKLLKMERVFR